MLIIYLYVLYPAIALTILCCVPTSSIYSIRVWQVFNKLVIVSLFLNLLFHQVMRNKTMSFEVPYDLLNVNLALSALTIIALILMEKRIQNEN